MKRIFFILVLLLNCGIINSQPYTIDTLVTGLQKPVSFAFISSNKVIVTLKDSTARVYQFNNNFLGTFWNFRDSLYTAGQESGLLGVCVDPNFAFNHYVYMYYTHLSPSSIRVVRFTEVNNTGTNPLIIFNHQQAQSGIHYGGNLHFGSDGKLYISVGTGSQNSDAQLLNTPRGKILRINSNGTIPVDNPFYDDGNPLTGRDDRIWVRGLRNSFDFCFSPFNDSIYAAENGSTIDELDFIRKGKNYGWPVCEGYCSPYVDSLRQPMTALSGFVPTGILVYNGSTFPSLSGKVIFASFNFQSLYISTLTGALDSVDFTVPWAYTGRVTSLQQGSDGNIYALRYGFSGDGAIIKILPPVNGITSQLHSEVFSLFQNYPNPFNPFTKIKFGIPALSGLSNDVKLVIYDALGKEIAVLVNEKLTPGNYETSWNAAAYPSGVYYYKLISGDFSEVRKMVLVK